MQHKAVLAIEAGIESLTKPRRCLSFERGLHGVVDMCVCASESLHAHRVGQDPVDPRPGPWSGLAPSEPLAPPHVNAVLCRVRCPPAGPSALRGRTRPSMRPGGGPRLAVQPARAAAARAHAGKRTTLGLTRARPRGDPYPMWRRRQRCMEPPGSQPPAAPCSVLATQSLTFAAPCPGGWRGGTLADACPSGRCGGQGRSPSGPRPPAVERMSWLQTDRALAGADTWRRYTPISNTCGWLAACPGWFKPAGHPFATR